MNQHFQHNYYFCVCVWGERIEKRYPDKCDGLILLLRGRRVVGRGGGLLLCRGCVFAGGSGGGGSTLLRLHCGEEDDLANVVGVRHEHHEAIQTESPTGSRGQTVGEGVEEVLVDEHCLVITGCLGLCERRGAEKCKNYQLLLAFK